MCVCACVFKERFFWEGELPKLMEYYFHTGDESKTDRLNIIIMNISYDTKLIKCFKQTNKFMINMNKHYSKHTSLWLKEPIPH